MSNFLGYAASGAVLATFLMRSMVPLRVIAIVSNILFLSYGYLEHITPVFLLHFALLPINVARLVACQNNRDRNPLISNPRLQTATNRVHQAALFVLGIAAGWLGIRALIYLALAFYYRCRCGSV